MNKTLVVLHREDTPDKLRAEEKRLGEELGFPVELSPTDDGSGYVLSAEGRRYMCEFGGLYWVGERWSFMQRIVVPMKEGEE